MTRTKELRDILYELSNIIRLLVILCLLCGLFVSDHHYNPDASLTSEFQHRHRRRRPPPLNRQMLCFVIAAATVIYF